ncbi:MAG TPA: porin family protein [Mariprofundaceae bacterium]|nr:porin family protein [Mariprofundaceae bacterium]
MKKMIVLAVAALAITGTASTANAQDVSYYAGLGLGTLNTEYKATGVDQTKTTFGGYIKAGADFNEYFAAELRLGMSGKNSKTIGGVSRTFSSPYFVSYLAKGKYPVTSDLDVFMLAGATTARIKGTSGTASQTVTKTGLSLGAGADYKLDNNVSVGAEWVQYMFPVNVAAGSVFGTNAKARMWGATVNTTYHF